MGRKQTDIDRITQLEVENERLRKALVDLAEALEEQATTYRSMAGVHSHAERDGEIFADLAESARCALAISFLPWTFRAW